MQFGDGWHMRVADVGTDDYWVVSISWRNAIEKHATASKITNSNLCSSNANKAVWFVKWADGGGMYIGDRAVPSF